MTLRTRFDIAGKRPVIPHWVTPRWGSECGVGDETQGVALGYGVDAPLARKNPRTNHFADASKMVSVHRQIPRTNGAKPVSPGQRPGTSPRPIPSPERAEPNTEARELEARIAENVVELLEA